MPLEDLEFADTPDALERGLQRLAALPVVGVDVERADWKRYYRSAALIQVGGHGQVLVIDPLTIEDFGPLRDYLADRRTVLHALENDLGPLETVAAAPPLIEDTAIAAAMLGLPTGLEPLLRDVLGVALAGDKQAMQRADWEARPLSQEMLAYAASDVADLPRLWDTLWRMLEEADRTDWYRQELAAALAQPSVEERREWTRTKGIGRLDTEALARVRALWQTREELARSTNTAPGRIVGDKVLIDLAVNPPRSAGELGRRGVRRQAVREFGDRLVAAAQDRPEAVEHRRRGRPPSPQDRARADRLRVIRGERAAQLNIDPGVLCPSRTLLSAVVTDPGTPEELRVALDLRPWQWDQLCEAFCEALGIPLVGMAAGDGGSPARQARSDGAESHPAVDEQEQIG